MYTVRLQITSESQYSQSRPHCEPKLEKESADAYEARTWHHRSHVAPDGSVMLPAMALRNCIAEAAKFLSIQIPGKGKATYTKHFESGILIPNNIKLFDKAGSPIVPPTEAGLKRVLATMPQASNAKEEDLAYIPALNEIYGDWVFVPADGVAGSGKRVWKCYPMIQSWTGQAEIAILDETITRDVLMKVLKEAGQLIGLGRFRVRNRGTYGRFTVQEV